MGSSPLLSKFGPLGLLVAMQLVLVLVLPSTAPGANGSSALGTGYSSGTGAGGTTTTSGAPGTPGSTSGLPGAAATGAAGTGAAGTGSGQGPGPGVTGSQPTTTSVSTGGVGGDTTHCVSGRQYSPSIDFFAPPCTPGTVGAADPSNGGATWQGVTGQQIEVVNYVADYGAEVDAILKAQGLYYTAAQAQVWDGADAAFIDSHYQLYGRKIHIDSYQGTCTTVPPDYTCLIGEMDKIVTQYHPYAVFWNTTVCSACYAELSRLHVVNFGGAGFSDAFHNANAPYSFDAAESSSRVELQFAKWWCSQMTSQRGSGRTAIFAGTENPAQNFRHSKRVLGVISTNDPDNEATVKQVLFPALQSDCGESVTHTYFYAQNINTATQQSQEGTARMDTTSNPATSVLCLCDPVAPQFAYNASASDNYWPESLIASDQTMDWDSSAQTYDGSLACPNPNQGCPFDNAIGLGADDPQTAPAQSSAVKVWNLETGGKALPVSSAVLQIFWDNYNMLGSMIENTGPQLTPPRMQALAPQMGARGGGTTGYVLRQFLPNDWCWNQDVAVMYWDHKAISPYNGVAGHWIPVEGSRFNFNFPAFAEPPAPEPENRK
ncbi:MAG TPA: hypothetical protein VNG13_07970 [Mycobacteriales bacterium]|nr:hypothetical protein [Mycobacteriales bacterium]